MSKLILSTSRSGYGTDQIRRTMTVGELIEALSRFDEDTPIYTGHDQQRDGSWYTYGGIDWEDLIEIEEEEEENND